jgi:hypothetical protein
MPMSRPTLVAMCAAVLSLSESAFGEPDKTRIHGQVVDASGNGVANAPVILDCADVQDSTRTDISGRYEFTDAPTGLCSVTARLDSPPATASITVVLLAGRTLEVTLRPGKDDAQGAAHAASPQASTRPPADDRQHELMLTGPGLAADASRSLQEMPPAESTRTSPFGTWSGLFETTWTDARGFAWRSSAAEPDVTARAPLALSAPFHPTWQLRMRATWHAPAGLQVTGTIARRRAYVLPLFLSAAPESNRLPISAGALAMDPASYAHAWDATLQIRRDVALGSVRMGIFGEAFTSFGGQGLRPRPRASFSAPGLLPTAPGGRAVRVGVVFGF